MMETVFKAQTIYRYMLRQEFDQRSGSRSDILSLICDVNNINVDYIIAATNTVTPESLSDGQM
jgi:hypothetical protein